MGTISKSWSGGIPRLFANIVISTYVVYWISVNLPDVSLLTYGLTEINSTVPRTRHVPIHPSCTGSMTRLDFEIWVSELGALHVGYSMGMGASRCCDAKNNKNN